MNFDLQLYREAAREHREKWALVQTELCSLCRRHPAHTDKNVLFAKLLIIGRSYATGIERQIANRGKRRGRAIEILGDHLWKQRDKLDRIIASVASVDEPLNAAATRTILDAHGRLVRLIETVTEKQGRGTCARSFASKYLHFHNPAVPIYDSYAAKAARTHRFPRGRVSSAFARPTDCDEKYAAFVARLCLIADAVRLANDKNTETISIKLLDKYLLKVADTLGAKRKRSAQPRA